MGRLCLIVYYSKKPAITSNTWGLEIIKNSCWTYIFISVQYDKKKFEYEMIYDVLKNKKKT